MQALTFEIPSLGADGDLEVLDFAGEEALSQLFTFDVVAGTKDTQVGLDDLIRQKVTLTLDVSSEGSGHEQRTFYGIITAVTDAGEAHGEHYLFFYRMTVKPLFWLMTLHRRSRVFRSMTVPDIAKEVLEDNGFGGSDVRFDLRTRYPVRDYCVQYEESDWAFVNRLLEDEGIFYHFIPEGDREVMVITDYNPEEGGPFDIGEVQLLPKVALATDLVHMTAFTGRFRMTPETVRYLDHDVEDFPTGPAVREVPTNEEAPERYGVYEEYDELMRDARAQTGWSGEAPDAESAQDADRQDRLRLRAERRKEEILANHGAHYYGTSNQSLFGHGHVFELTNTERYANKYLILRVRHVGSQRALFRGMTFTNLSDEGFGEAFDKLFQTLKAGSDQEGSRQGGYGNGITCIELARPYRPPRQTPVPRIPSVINGTIEHHPGEKLLDNEGHYLVRMFFDQENPFKSETSEASRPVRRMQVSGGRDWGTHFPSAPGTEGLVAFLNGNPDAPVLLGNVPTMATHTPVPNTALGLGSENPDEQRWNDQRISYDEKKHVVRTAVGHQLVMDDDTGRANVGVTLQAGTTPSEGDGQAEDVYWGSKLELGGHRQKGAAEQDVDRHTQGLNNLNAGDLAPGPLPGLIQQALDEDAYWEDAASDVTPAGAHLYTHNRVELVARNGIDLSAANAPGAGGGGGRLDVDQNRGVMAAVGKFLQSTLWRAALTRGRRLLGVLKEQPGAHGDAYAGQPIIEEPATHISARAEALLKAKVYEALRLPGVAIGAAGPVTTTSFTSVATVAGEGGHHTETFGDLTQRAELDASFEAGQLIRIRTRGFRQEEGELEAEADSGSGGLSDARSAVQSVLNAVRDVVDGVFGRETPQPQTFPILLQNEHGGITLHTEGKGKGSKDDPGPIDLFAEEGDVRLRTRRDGKVATHAEKEITLIVEKSASSGVLDKFYDGELSDHTLSGDAAKVALSPTNAETYAKEFIRLQTHQDAPGNKMAPFIQIEKDESITLQCGMSMIRLKKDGTIDIEGMNINIKAQQNINEEAMMQLNEKAMMVSSKADVKYDIQSPLTTVKGDATLTARGGMVMIN